ncbi:MAG: heparinase II/III family protein [Anaerolineae bacterium]|nr:heparinase II/III family protein [Anaerolineae bacterium]
MSKLQILMKALRELGPTQVGLLALYKLGLKSGHYRRSENTQPQPVPFNFPLPLPEREKLLSSLGPGGLSVLRQNADEIVGGQFRAFGGPPVPIQLAPPSPQTHWTKLETRPHPTDIKHVWEPARFGWAFHLGRAWLATGDEAYPAAFWRYFETFQAENPPFLGENWTSGQEVGLRLIALAWAGAAFHQSEHTTPIRLATLAAAIGLHAGRIVPTVVYARAQNNNHLLTEAAALYTAALALPDHPQSAGWHKTGQKWLAWCFKHQIDSSGEYIQHSTNYHRLMLQTALWMRMVSGIEYQGSGKNLTPDTSHLTPPHLTPSTRENLSLAAHWLFCLLDFESGKVPNFGPNDGAYIFPLTNQPIEDYRPVVQAAARAFLGYSLPPGAWDEMSLWFNVENQRLKVEAATPSDLRILGIYPTTLQASDQSWAYLRTARLRSRPGHADLLNLDLWWRGQNITLDPGTFQYNAPPPWDNPLTSALHHNTVTVDGLDQFTRARRFLYLDRADALRVKSASGSISARHYAYSRLGVRHTRVVTTLTPDHWQVEDELLNLHSKPHTYRLHWLLPDGEYELKTSEEKLNIRLKLPNGWLNLQITTPKSPITNCSLARAGDIDPLRGWFSPTYAVKVPALSLAVEVQSAENVGFVTEFIFPG